MKLSKSDVFFQEVCENPEKRTELLKRLVFQRKIYYILSGFAFVLCMAEQLYRLSRANGSASSSGGFMQFIFVAMLALYTDSRIKTLLSIK